VTLRARGRVARADSLADAQKLAGAFLKPRPGWLDEDRLVIRLFFQRFGTTTFINLHKLHQSIHPWSQSIRQGCSPECDDDLGAATVYLPAPDLHNLADRNRFVAAKIKNSFQDEVGVQPGGTEGRRVAGLKGEGEQGTRIECPMVIGITRQDKAMSQGFEVLGLRLRHARRVPRNVNWSGHGAIANKNITRFVRPLLLEVKWRGSTGAERSQPWVSRPSLNPAEVWTDPHSRVSLQFFEKEHKDFTRRMKNPRQAGV